MLSAVIAQRNSKRMSNERSSQASIAKTKQENRQSVSIIQSNAHSIHAEHVHLK